MTAILSSPVAPWILAWLLVTVLSVLLRVLTPDHPRAAALAAALASIGLDPTKLGVSLMQIVNGKAPPQLAGVLLTAENVIGAVEAVGEKPAAPPKPPSGMIGMCLAFLLVGLIGAVSAACSAAGPIASAAVNFACSLVVPLLVSSPEGTLVAGTICKDAAPYVGPLVSILVGSLAKERRAALAARQASSASYVPLIVAGQRVGSLDASLTDAAAAQGWVVDSDGVTLPSPKDGGK